MSDNEVAAGGPVYRSGAVARLTGIPVQTLRVWERRYKIVGPRQSATGQRQYSPDDVARLTVIKRLVDSGHAIGSIATLQLDELRPMLAMTARDSRGLDRPADAAADGAGRSVRVAIVGDALALRVAHFQLPAVRVVATSADAAGAIAALPGVAVDILLVELPTLQRESAQLIRSLARQLGPHQIVVEYGYGPQRIQQELRVLGCTLVHAPMEVDQLESLCQRMPAAPRVRTTPVSSPQIGPAAPPRFDRKTLAEISLASVALNCECPHHISQLLVQLGNFETYSAECESRSPADAELHRFLKDVTGSARAILEDAMVRVLEAEGIPLPA
jgi:DNA-binding transcriptional MerR regulator